MYTFSGMTAAGAARRLDRTWSTQDMTAAAATTETHTAPYNFFTVPQNDEIKGSPLAGSSQPVPTTGNRTAARDIAAAGPVRLQPVAWRPGPNPGGPPSEAQQERWNQIRADAEASRAQQQSTPSTQSNSPAQSSSTPTQTAPTPTTNTDTPAKTPASEQPAPQPATGIPDQTSQPGTSNPNTGNPVIAQIVGIGGPADPRPPAEGSLGWLLAQAQSSKSTPETSAPPQQPVAESSPPARIDPALLQSYPILQITYNADGTIKVPEQQNGENAARNVINQLPGVEDPAQSNPAQRVVDTVTSGVRPPGVVGPQELADLTTALGHGEDGTTPLTGGGELTKTISHTDTGWQTGYDVTLSNGQHLSWTNSGVQANWQLSNGNTVAKSPFDEARKTTYDDITRAYAVARATGRDLATDPAIVAAQRASTMLSTLGGKPDDLVKVIRDRDGNIVQVAVTDRNGVEHIVADVTDKFAPGLQFEFYRHPGGTVTDRSGRPLVMVNGSQLHLDTDHTVTIPPNPAAQHAAIQDHKPGSDSAYEYIELPDSPASGTNDPRRYVRRPDTSIWAEIAEIPVPPGITAQRLYKVAGGGVLVEDTTGTHWATDPGKALSVSDELKGVAIDLAFLAAGEGVGWVVGRGLTTLGRYVTITRGATRTATEAVDASTGRVAPRNTPETHVNARSESPLPTDTTIPESSVNTGRTGQVERPAEQPPTTPHEPQVPSGTGTRDTPAEPRLGSGTAVENGGSQAVIETTGELETPLASGFGNPSDLGSASSAASKPGAGSPVKPAAPPGSGRPSEPWAPRVRDGKPEGDPRGNGLNHGSVGRDPLEAAVDRGVDLGDLGVKPSWRADTEPVFRSDNRPPDMIFDSGFSPRDITNTRLRDYVAEDQPSAFVSTSRRLDISEEMGGKYTYEIDVPGGIDINETLGPHEMSYEQEIAFPGGIRNEFIVGVRPYNYATGELGEMILNPNYRSWR
ncbi:hypothetical protein [Nocardia sp. NPDC051570]|uniref:scabin-related ADP-ribosyltransferase n=1 Tax=Nocardia sp. NPDC051570 TaxID=3364324 RepID=UPI00379211D6